MLNRHFLIVANQCVMHISDLTIANVSLIGSPSYPYSYMIAADLSELWLSNITIVNSGSSGYFLNAQFSTLYISDLNVDNYFSGTALCFFGGGGFANVSNVRMTRGTSKSQKFKEPISEYLYKNMHFAVYSSDIEARNISISDSLEPTGPCFSLILSNYSISHIVVSRMSSGSILSEALCSGSISNVYIDKTIIDMHAFESANSLTAVSSVLFINSQLIEKYCVLVFGKSQVTIHNFTLTNSSVPALILSSKSTIAALNLVVEECNIGWSTCHIVLSQIHMQDLKLQNSDIRRLSVTNTNLTITQSVFSSLISQDFLLEIVHSNVSFLNASWGNISTVKALALVTDSSRFVIEKCDFESLRTVEERGFWVSESVLNVSDSRFRSFNFALFQAVSSNITLLNSIVTEGRNPSQWLRSELAYGGVLSCTDCPFVSIKNSKFANVSAKLGGAAVAKRKRSTGELRLVVEKSSFVGCRASQAGALFIQNVSFTIDNSLFASNSAEQNGGGIYASIKSTHTGIVRNSVFQGNSAFEGGGIKWSNSPILFTNVSFRANSAAYGANVASYGVSLSSLLTPLKGNETSGYPLTLIFELQDHYGQRVTLSSFKYLTLQSTATAAIQVNRGAVLHQGLFVFTEVIILARPGFTAVIEAVFSDSQEDFALTIVGSVSLPFRSCISGEIGHSNRCEYCPTGYVSFYPSDPHCFICPAHMVCPGGSSRILDPHYWSNASDTMAFQLCPIPNKCTGGANSTCVEGFTGPLCTQCAEGYTRISGTDCVSCSVLLVVMQLCCAFLVILLQGWAVLRYAVYCPDFHKLYVTKVLINHFQYLSFLCYLGVSYTRGLTWSLHVVNCMSLFLVPDLPLACLGLSSSVYFKALIGSLILPVLLLCYGSICYLSMVNWKMNLLVLSTSVLFYTPIIAVVTSIPLLACQTVNSVEYLFFNMATQCWDKVHKRMAYQLVLPSLLLNVGGTWAAVLLYFICRPQVFAIHCPLWSVGYKVQLWDVPLSLAKYLFAAAMIAGLKSSALLQVIYSLIILIVTCILNVALNKQTYCSASHFFLSEISLLVVGVSAGFLSYYMFYLPGSLQTEWVIDALVLVINSMFVGLCVWSITSKKLYDAVLEERENSYTPSVPPNTPTSFVAGQLVA